jgi:microcystin-dependent protein
MTAHRDLTGSDLHEPKGIEDAAADQVYVADGSGTGVWTSISLSVPVGAVMDYAGSSAPSGWLFCYGQDVSRTTYADLFTAISTTYGSGNGSTTFTLPDCRGRVSAGKDDMGGTSANRLTNQTGGLNGDTLGATGGAETHTLTEAQLAAHDHDATGLTASTSVSLTNETNVVRNLSTQSIANGGGAARTGINNFDEDTISASATTTISGDTADAGSGAAHNNVQPTIIFNKIIYSGVS